MPEQRHKISSVIHQIIEGFTAALPAETQQVPAQPIREELVGRQVFESPHLLQNENERRQHRPPSEGTSGLTRVKFMSRSCSAEASLSCLKVKLKSERVSSISYRRNRQSESNNRRPKCQSLAFSRKVMRKPSSSSSPRRPSLALNSWWILKTTDQTALFTHAFSICAYVLTETRYLLW